MYIKNSRGPEIVPCGTPVFTLQHTVLFSHDFTTQDTHQVYSYMIEINIIYSIRHLHNCVK